MWVRSPPGIQINLKNMNKNEFVIGDLVKIVRLGSGLNGKIEIGRASCRERV